MRIIRNPEFLGSGSRYTSPSNETRHDSHFEIDYEIHYFSGI